MIIVAALLMMQAYSPETEAVMNRSRQRAADKRAEKAAQTGGDGTAASNARQGVDKPLPMPPEMAAKFQGCLDAGTTDPDAGVRFAEAWRIDGGGFHARECMGFALARRSCSCRAICPTWTAGRRWRSRPGQSRRAGRCCGSIIPDAGRATGRSKMARWTYGVTMR